MKQANVSAFIFNKKVGKDQANLDWGKKLNDH